MGGAQAKIEANHGAGVPPGWRAVGSTLQSSMPPSHQDTKHNHCLAGLSFASSRFPPVASRTCCCRHTPNITKSDDTLNGDINPDFFRLHRVKTSKLHTWNLLRCVKVQHRLSYLVRPTPREKKKSPEKKNRRHLATRQFSCQPIPRKKKKKNERKKKLTPLTSGAYSDLENYPSLYPTRLSSKTTTA